MTDYIAPPIIVEPDDLAEGAFDYLATRIEGWLPSPGNLEVWELEALSQMASELTYVASTVPTSIFRYYGESLVGVLPQEAVPATAATTWTLRDALGYTIPQGTLVGIPASGDELLAFEVSQDTVVPAGQVTARGVICVAQDAGVDANGLSGDPELIDALDWVVSVTLDAQTSGGVDGETDDEYLNRLRELFTVLAPRPILPNDFAIMAKQVPGVFRATAIDLYNPGPPVDTNCPRCVSVVVMDDVGNDVSPDILQQVDDLLQSNREVNFLVFVLNPTRTDIDVVFTVKAYPDYDPDAIAAAAEQSVRDYLAPANFGSLPYGDTPQWLSDDHVRYLEIAEAINRTEGVWYIGTLTLNGGTADVALAGPGPMPRAGMIDGTPL